MATLAGSFAASAERFPRRVAVEDPAGRTLTYCELDRRSTALCGELRALGVGVGDRVGFCFEKSIASIVSICAISKAGAAYVPLDPEAPAARNAYILHDCAVRVTLTGERGAARLAPELERLGAPPPMLLLDTAGGAVSEHLGRRPGDAPAAAAAVAPDDLAYILYTSGSTGRPKGVMLSHANATAFLDWCSRTFGPVPEDRFSSHAPLHFDLSVLDVHLALRHGAALVLIAEDIAKDPLRLAPLIAERRLTVWYSAPSILAFLAQLGKLERHDLSALRWVLFAGEVFPIKHLRALRRLIPEPRYCNLYGPTETNVCTFFELPREIPAERREPFPIGKPCAGTATRVVDRRGAAVATGEEGELLVRGPTVTRGYWNLPEETARAFLPGDDGGPWYRTGDLVREDTAGDYVFLGRRDRMIKRRGYRIELDEIEHCLYRYPGIEEAGVVALEDSAGELRIHAVLGCTERPSVLALKRFCGEHLPGYMLPDRFRFLASLPRTSTGKVDYVKLAEPG